MSFTDYGTNVTKPTILIHLPSPFKSSTIVGRAAGFDIMFNIHSEVLQYSIKTGILHARTISELCRAQLTFKCQIYKK